jgi:hypothetical protein
VLQNLHAEGKIHGAMKPTGIRPTFAERFARAGITLPDGIFVNERK